MDQALAALHAANPDRLPVSFILGRAGDAVTLLCRFPPELRATVEGQLYAQYPDARLDVLPEDALQVPDNPRQWQAELQLRTSLFPIRDYRRFEDALNRITADPLSALLVTLTRGRGQPLHARIELTVRPLRLRTQQRAQRCLARIVSSCLRSYPRLAGWYAELVLSSSFSRRTFARLLGLVARGGPRRSTPAGPDPDFTAAADKLARPLFKARICLHVAGPAEAADRANQLLREMAGAFGVFAAAPWAVFRRTRLRQSRPGRRPRFTSPILLAASELATLWHPPTATVRTPTLPRVESRELEPPVTLPRADQSSDLAVLGQAIFRDRRQRFGIRTDDRRRHLALLGKTGMGKSTLLHRLMVSDIAAGRGVGLIDPHGDLVEAVLRTVPGRRTNDVVLFDAGDAGRPLAFNPLACSDPAMRPLVASGVLSAFKKLYGEFWGPRLEHILRNALLAVLETPQPSLLGVLRLLCDARFRKSVTAAIRDPVVRAFWEREFAGMPPKFQAEAIAPILNKIGAFVSSPVLRRLIGQSRSTLDLGTVMDQGKVLLVNLSKGRVGDDASSLLGSLLVTSVQLAAMRRADRPEAERRDFYLFVDEFQNFATESFAAIFSEARKYRLNLTVANQYLAQLDESTLHALFGNVGSLACFQCGAKDAELLAEQLGGDLTPQDLMRLPRYNAYTRLLIDGMPSFPFSMQTLPPPKASDPQRPEIIRRYCRQRYGRPLAAVDAEIEATFAGT